jgi:uncharacterized protein YbcI
LKAVISTEVVRLFRQHTGRGPTKAKTTISDGVIVVTLADCLTTPEKQLLDAGQRELVEQTRSALHRGMRAEAVHLVERLTRTEVVAYLNDQEFDPDLAVIVFVLAPVSRAAA